MTESEQSELHGLRTDLAKYNQSQERRLDIVAGKVVDHNRISEAQLEEIRKDIKSVREWINGDNDSDGAKTRLRVLEDQARDQKWAFRTAVVAILGVAVNIAVNLFMWLVKGRQ